MAGRGRNEPCDCGSGRKTKRCCGERKGPSDSEMAKAFLAGLMKPAALALIDLASSKRSLLFTSGLVQSVAVVLGAERTPSGLLIAG